MAETKAKWTKADLCALRGVLKKLSSVCFTANGHTVCLKCNKYVEDSKHWRSIFMPSKPFEHGEEGRGYMYALCMPCFEEVMDGKTGMPKEGWLEIFEEEIQYLITQKKIPRFKADMDGRWIPILFGRSTGVE